MPYLLDRRGGGISFLSSVKVMCNFWRVVLGFFATLRSGHALYIKAWVQCVRAQKSKEKQHTVLARCTKKKTHKYVTFREHSQTFSVSLTDCAREFLA